MGGFLLLAGRQVTGPTPSPPQDLYSGRAEAHQSNINHTPWYDKTLNLLHDCHHCHQVTLYTRSLVPSCCCSMRTGLHPGYSCSQQGVDVYTYNTACQSVLLILNQASCCLDI